MHTRGLPRYGAGRDTLSWENTMRFRRCGHVLAAIVVVCVLALTAGKARADDQPRLLVMELERGNVEPDWAKAINTVTASSVAEVATGYDVLTAADVRRLMDLEAERELMECEAGNSCMAELGAAMGAERAVFGALAQTGGTTVVTLDLFDTERGAAVARVTVAIEKRDALLPRMKAGVRELLQRSEPGPAWAPWATSLGGVTLLAGAALSGYAAYSLAALPQAGQEGVQNTQTLGLVGTGLAVAGAVALIAGGLALPAPEEAP